MADHINDEELEELNEIYRQKLEAQKHGKAARPRKKDNADKAEKKNKMLSAEKHSSTDKNKAAPADDKNDGESSRIKKLPYIINIGACSVFFAAVIVGLLALPRPTISETEKRELAKFPEFSWDSYWKGDYTEGISNFFNDTVPFRDEFKQIGANFRSLFGFSIDGAVISGEVDKVNSNTSDTSVTTQSTKPIEIVIPSVTSGSDKAPEETDKPEESSNSSDASGSSDTSDSESKPNISGTFPTPSDPDAEVLYSEGYQIVYQSGGELYATALYYGKRSYAEDYAAAVNKIKENLPDVNVYNMTFLTQNTFITPSELNKGTYTEQADCTYLNNMLSSDIVNISSLDALAPHIDEDIFFLRDCHWQQLGAYYAAQSFAKEAGVKFPDISKYEKIEKDCLGSVYQMTHYDGLMYEGETFTYYVPTNEYDTDYYYEDYEPAFESYPMIMPESDYNPTSFYSTFMVSDSYIKHITTDADNGRVLMVLKDDYSSAMVPFLTSSFEEIYVIDVRYCDFNPISFAAEHGVTDVFVGMTTENALGEIGTNLEYILSL